MILRDAFAAIKLFNAALNLCGDLALLSIAVFRVAWRSLHIHTLQWYRSHDLTFLVAIFVVLFGLAFGSFLNVCISRLPRHESIVRPRSRCPRCGAAIQSRDNIPILSWILLRGRCRHCRERIAWRYPAVEFATAALFVLCYLRFGLTVTGVGMAALCFLLLGLAAMDAETMRLPDAFTWPGIVLGILYSGISLGFFRIFPQALILPWGLGIRIPHGSSAALRLTIVAMAASALWALLAALLLLLIRWLYILVRHQEGLGMGDVKLIAMIAAWLGPLPTILTLLLGALAAAVFGILAVALSKGKRPFLTTRLPFGTFLCAAAIYAIFAGAPIIAWYLRFYSIDY